MLHTYAVRFDVTKNLKKFWKLNKALASVRYLVHRYYIDTYGSIRCAKKS